MKTGTKTAMGCLAALACLCGHAGEGVWIKTEASVNNRNYRDTISTDYCWYTNTLYWQGGFVPKTAADSADLSLKPVVNGSGNSLYMQYIRVPNCVPALTNGTLSGSAWHTLVIQDDKNLFTVGDASRYEGLVRSYSRSAGLAFMQSTRLPYFSADGMPRIHVPESADTATIASLGGRGLVSKTGAGTLRIEDGSYQANVRMGGGRLELAGHDYPDQLVANYTARFDASRADALETETGVDGRAYVNAWHDREHPGVQAWATNGTTRPFVRPGYLNGKNVVDFGAYWGTLEKVTDLPDYFREALGQPALLKTTDTKIGSLFYVAEETQRSNCAPVVIGQDVSGYFVRKFDNLEKTPTVSGLLFTEYLRSEFQTGDLRLNGTRVPHHHYEPGGFARWMTYSFVPNGDFTADLKWNQLMADRGNRRGGARLAEVVSYPTRLSAEEIRQNNAYLRKKWFGTAAEAADADVGVVYLTGNAALSIDVPAGKTSRLPVLTRGDTAKATPVKTGGGRLVLDVVTPADMPLEVEEGEIAFADMATRGPLTAPSPAEDPYVWLKADDVAARFTFETENGTNFITRWNDTRETQTAEYAYHNAEEAAPGPYQRPWLEAGALNGKAVVNFGDFGDMDEAGAALMFKGQAACSPVEGFVVWRSHRADSDPWIFGARYGNSMVRSSSGNDGQILNSSNADIWALGALWYVDGEIVDAFNVKLRDDFHVINFAAREGVRADMLGGDRADQKTLHRGGGVSIAEVIYYTRTLTEDERRRTQAYLLAKWKNAPAPRSAPRTLAHVSFSAGATPRLGVESDTRIAHLSGAGTLHVSGPAALAVDYAKGVDGVAVDAATVTLPLETAAEKLIKARAALWLDASQTHTLTFEKDADGALTDRVLGWADANGGIYAMKSWTAVATNPPALMSVTIGGKSRPAIDFHEMCQITLPQNDCPATMTTNAASSMLLAKNGDFGGKTIHTLAASECFTVMADAPSANASFTHRASIFCTKYDGINIFQRDKNNNGAIVRIDANQCAPARDGEIFLDGEQVEKGTKVADFDFHAYGAKPTSAQNIAAIGLYRTGGNEWFYGGLLVCEQIYFVDPLTDEERALVFAYLRKKWQNVGDPLAVSLEELSLTGGAVFHAALPDYATPLSIASLCGQSGTYDVSRLSVADPSLSFTFTASDACNTITVKGALTLPDTVNVTLGAAAGIKPAVGVHTLLSAVQLEGAQTLTLVNALPGGLVARAYVEAGALKVRISAGGTLMLLR